jgi:cytochrome P450
MERTSGEAPRVSGWVPWVGAGISLLNDPTEFFAQSRRKYGDTFLVEAFGYRLFCVFSPEGIENLWALPEALASKGVADFGMLAHKVPAALFAGRRTFPHMLFAREDVEVYLGNLVSAVELELDAMGGRGEFEAFALCRRLAHHMGLASWGSRAATKPESIERLISAFDALDSSESFVHPPRAFLTWATGKRREHAALATIESIFGEILKQLPPLSAEGTTGEPGFFDRIRAAWRDTSGDDQVRGIARDVVLVHMGSQSNLFAAMAWTLVHLLERPALLESVRKGDDALLERCAHESIRLRRGSTASIPRTTAAPCSSDPRPSPARSSSRPSATGPITVRQPASRSRRSGSRRRPCSSGSSSRLASGIRPRCADRSAGSPGRIVLAGSATPAAASASGVSGLHRPSRPYRASLSLAACRSSSRARSPRTQAGGHRVARVAPISCGLSIRLLSSRPCRDIAAARRPPDATWPGPAPSGARPA